MRMFRVRKRDAPSQIVREDFFLRGAADKELLDHLISMGVLKVLGEEKGKRFIGWAESLEALRGKFPDLAKEITV